MKEWVGEAKTPDQALALGLKKLGLTENQVDMKILKERSSTLLSLFGYRRVKVRVVEKTRRFDRGDHTHEFERSPNDNRFGFKRRRSDSDEEDRPVPAKTRGKSRGDNRSVEHPAPPVRDNKGNRSPRTKEKQEKFTERKPQRTNGGERSPASPPRSQKKQPKPNPAVRRDKQMSLPTFGEGPFHPPIPPETLLTQWRDLLGWDDLAWKMKPVDNRRLPVEIKTSRGAQLAGNGGRALESFEYLFNLVSSGGDREKPWVSFRIAGFPSAEESRVVDKALFAAFQVRRTGKPFHLDPMSASQRRAVHQTLVNNPDIQTGSEGEGPMRHVVVRSKEKKE